MKLNMLETSLEASYPIRTKTVVKFSELRAPKKENNKDIFALVSFSLQRTDPTKNEAHFTRGASSLRRKFAVVFESLLVP